MKKLFIKSGGRIFLSASLAIIFLVTFSSCSWLNNREQKAWTAVDDFITTADAKVSGWCSAGRLPPAACAEWIEIKAELCDRLDELKDRWAGLKEKAIDYRVRFLAGKLRDVGVLPDYATGDALNKAPEKPDASGILESAQKAQAAGFLTEDELAALFSAADM